MNFSRINRIAQAARPLLRPLPLAALGISVIVLAPIGVVLASFLSPTHGVWGHLVQTVLLGLVVNTTWLVLGVAVGTTLIGVTLAWLTATCDFPGRRILDWALVLPLALPTYVTAFVGIGLLDFTGPIQTQLRMWLGLEQLTWFPRIRSSGGVIAVMTLALYPYVYLLARNAFRTQGRRAMEAARTLGYGRWRGFFHVALPMARPWIVSGLMLALMETLADFGAVSIFNYDTFTTAIYEAWFGLSSLTAAAQLSSLLVLIVFGLVWLEQRSRLRAQYTDMGRGGPAGERMVLKGVKGGFGTAICGLVLAMGFLIPVGQLLIWAYGVMAHDLDVRYFGFLGHSLLLGTLGALLTCTAALLLVYAVRWTPNPAVRLAARLSTLGYAIPGAVLAVSFFLLLTGMERALGSAVKSLFGMDVSLLIRTVLVAMLLAYLVRFLAVAFGPIESVTKRITTNIDEAARGLGAGGVRLLRRVHFPVIRGGLLTAAALVFVDVVKEMPITLMTRPFGWDTLAIRIFELTSEGEWERAALPAVALVLTGWIPVMLLTREEGRATKER
jgi:iron(III) transport system permease protein